MRRIKFTCHETHCDRKHYVNEEDVRVVLSRLPDETWERLRAVHFNDHGLGGRRCGYTDAGRREIALCALPPRVSLTSLCLQDGRSPRVFGAVRGLPWPERAVRRFMLYDVFLHELGHLQIVDERAKSDRRKFARERRAQEFADFWRRLLWRDAFDHPDPAHNRPAEEELLTLTAALG